MTTRFERVAPSSVATWTKSLLAALRPHSNVPSAPTRIWAANLVKPDCPGVRLIRCAMGDQRDSLTTVTASWSMWTNLRFNRRSVHAGSRGQGDSGPAIAGVPACLDHGPATVRQDDPRPALVALSPESAPRDLDGVGAQVLSREVDPPGRARVGQS